MFSQTDFPQYDNRFSLKKTNRLKRSRNQVEGRWFQESSFFIKLKCLTKDAGFATTNPFRIRDSISAVLHIPTESLNIDLLRNGEILFPVKNKSLVDLMVSKSPLSLPGLNLEVEAQLDVFANSSKGKVEAPCWDKIPKDELMGDLRDQGITDIYRVKRLRKGEYVNTHFYILSFNTTKCPSKINIGFYNAICKQHIPTPSICKNCFKFNHSAKSCKSGSRCGNCGSLQHQSAACSFPKRCANCLLDNHVASSRACPEYLKAKKVKIIMALEGVSRNTAQRKMIELVRCGDFCPREESKILLALSEQSHRMQQPEKASINCKNTATHTDTDKTSTINAPKTGSVEAKRQGNNKKVSAAKNTGQKSGTLLKDRPHPYQGTEFDPNIPPEFVFRSPLPERSQSSCSLANIPEDVIFTRTQSQASLHNPAANKNEKIVLKFSRKTKSSTDLDAETGAKQGKTDENVNNPHYTIINSQDDDCDLSDKETNTTPTIDETQ